MNRWTVFALASGLLAAALPTGAASAADPGRAPGEPGSLVESRLRARVESLCAPVLAGRAAGSPGGHAAADTIAAWFAAAGLRPAFGESWRQPFPLHGEGWTGDSLAGRDGVNVGGALPGAGALASRWLVVAAHLDHLGAVDPAPAAVPVAGGYYPGANDNASGVAILHELVRSASTGGGSAAERRSILFLNLDAEEVGLQGAAWFVDHAPVDLDSIDAMLNLDTVGRLADDRLVVSGIGTASALEEAVASASRASGVAVNPSRGGWSGSDHMVFNTREVPVLFLFGGPYPEYNRPADEPSRLDYAAMARVAGFGASLLASLAAAHGDFAWVAVEGALRDDIGAQGPGNRNTWLGTMPDFTEGLPGYRIGSVFADSPAAAAGLAKGDVMVSFGDYPVTDLATFTTALRAHAPGDLVEIGILREGRTLRFTVALGDRAQRR